MYEMREDYSAIQKLWNRKLTVKLLKHVCLYPKKRQNGWTDRAQILCGTSCGPRKGLWMIKISKTCLHQNSENFEKVKNHRNFLMKYANFLFVLFYNVHKENMFTIKIEDGREAP